MKTIDIAEMLEKRMIEAVADHLEEIVTLTDFGMQLDEDNKKVYRTHMAIRIDVIQETPVGKCQNSSNPVVVRKMSDRERLELLAAELMGITE